jgi:ATP-dependent Clp protease adapter protein ClpS
MIRVATKVKGSVSSMPPWSKIYNKTTTLPRRGLRKSVPTFIEPSAAITEMPIQEVFNVDVIMPNFSFAPIFRVILRYNNWGDDKEVAKMVKQSVPVITYSAAKQIVSNAKAYGQSIVITTVQEDATKYLRNLLSKGLDADIIEA